MDYVNCIPIRLKTHERKIWSFTKYLEYLESVGIQRLSQIEYGTIHEYIASLTSYVSVTLRIIKTNLRETYDWMYEKNMPFSRRQLFPLIHKDSRNEPFAYYSQTEIQQLLSCIDTGISSGKCMYTVICLLAYIGMRAGNVINLRSISRISSKKQGIHCHFLLLMM